jgi:hypothetical protein
MALGKALLHRSRLRGRACLDELIERHRRKYKLRPLLEELRGR